jgi:hypothetical protein
MSVQTLDGYIRITAGAVLTPYVLVKPDGTLCAVSLTKIHAGVTTESASASGKLVTLVNPVGRYVKVVANAAITAGAAVYYDANGTVGVTAASNTQLGVAIDAASGAGSIITVAFT